MKQQKTRKRIEAAFIEPMQCKPVTVLPVGEKWSFEIKFDGYRCIAVKVSQEVTLFSRHKKVLNKRFPGVVDVLSSLDSDFVLDGELVALDSKGRPSFQILQKNPIADVAGLFLRFRPAEPRRGIAPARTDRTPARLAEEPACRIPGSASPVSAIAGVFGRSS